MEKAIHYNATRRVYERTCQDISAINHSGRQVDEHARTVDQINQYNARISGGKDKKMSWLYKNSRRTLPANLFFYFTLPHQTVKMQFTLSPKILIALLPFLPSITAQGGDDTTPAKTTPMGPKVSSYLAHIQSDSKYSSIAAVISTAAPPKAQSRLLNGEISKLSTRSWYPSLPSDVQSWEASVYSEVQKIAAPSTASAAAATSAPAKSGVSSAASTSTSSSIVTAPKSAASPSATAASAAVTASKNSAVETGAAKLMGVGVAAGVIGALVF
ncbi:hypothetical protein EJ08DRAFT_680856 [Tothia fuscella]|uniref:Uncharacterized protein n=1 Tax=Tothia fuscella TaxID=1048955 RepID=A0A9P4NM24_9PEZI|nr:hypothetical protein EJ08DRAFT_680856 [Tothia fuscella]